MSHYPRKSLLDPGKSGVLRQATFIHLQDQFLSCQGRRAMLKKAFKLIAMVTAAITLLFAASEVIAAASSPGAALIGQVSSQEEGRMEGVLVSAKREDSTVTTTVVSDAQGRYSFPSSTLEPGRYSLRIRAVGYELENSQPAEVTAEKTTELDLKLR